MATALVISAVGVQREICALVKVSDEQRRRRFFLNPDGGHELFLHVSGCTAIHCKEAFVQFITIVATATDSSVEFFPKYVRDLRDAFQREVAAMKQNGVNGAGI